MDDMADKGILGEIADHPELIEVPLAVDATDMELFRRMLGSDSLVYNMSRTGIIPLLARFDTDMRRSLADVIGWDTALLKRLAGDPEHLRVLHRMWDIAHDREEFIRRYLRLLSRDDAAAVNLSHAFSQGQIDSKAWLVDTLADLGCELGSVWTLCGWVGTLAYILNARAEELGLTGVRSFDIDPNCADLAEALNSQMLQDGWRFKAFTADVNTLDYDNFEWTFWSKVNNRMSHPIREAPDTVINTSCDHMLSRSWFDSIPEGKLVVLQNNDWEENTQHTDTVDSVERFRSMYPMREYVFEGELDCKIYTRYMLVGRK